MPARSNPSPLPILGSTREKICLRSWKIRKALTTGTRTMWEYSSREKENRTRLLSGTQKMPRVRATKRRKLVYRVVLSRDTFEWLEDAANCSPTELRSEEELDR